jgi:hypothetical protein
MSDEQRKYVRMHHLILALDDNAWDSLLHTVDKELDPTSSD